MPHETPENCLILAVESIGTPKTVGSRMRPEMQPQDAGKWLTRCLSDEHKQRLNYGQVRLLYKWNCEAGQHEAFRRFAESIGYRIEPIDRSAEIIALQQRAERSAIEAGELTERAKALMQAVGLKVECA